MNAIVNVEAASPPAGASLRAAIRIAGFVGLALIVVLVAMSDVIARAPADAGGIGHVLAAPSAAFPFGTDVMGRDLLSETLHALSVTLAYAVIAMVVTLATGGFAGFVAARLPWRMGAGLRWMAGILGAVPALLLAILFIGIAGRAFAPVAAGLAAAPLAFARSYDRARALARSRHAEFARATGIPEATLMRRDLVYEFRDTFLTSAARALAAVTITISTVSFLGFGAVPPHRDLGLMIAAAVPSYIDAWWTAAFPALALLLLILFARLAAALEEGERP
jgi:peptide/nickel transport system permease protein